jgi:N-acetylglucosamine kinase-like BadF-type ATPase
MNVVLGVDGGGSKTEVMVADLDGECLAVGRSGGSNWEGVGHDAAVEQIAVALDEALASAGLHRGDVVASAFGLAGIDWPSDVPPMRAALERLELAGPLVVDNDSRIALRAGSSTGWGIVSNVGTGTVTAGLDRAGRWFRTMAVGWGEPSGASSLVRDALHAVAAAHHGAAPATALTDAFLQRLGRTDVLDLFEALSRRRLRVGADLAPLVDDMAIGGDPVAAEIVRTSGRRHGEMVVGVAQRLEMEAEGFELVCCGSRHVHATSIFADAFAAAVLNGCPRASMVTFDGRPALGAVLLALDAHRRG